MVCIMECRGAKGVNDKKSASDYTGNSMVIKNLSSFGSTELDSYGALKNPDICRKKNTAAHMKSSKLLKWVEDKC